MLLSQRIKDATKKDHQGLEAIVVRKIKSIKSNEDYASFLKCFFSYFAAVEHNLSQFITTDILADYAERRNSSYLAKDIADLGGFISDCPEAHSPDFHNVIGALGGLYVLEGSIMGGRFILQMLEKLNIKEGISFFSGYGQDTGLMWERFISVFNEFGQSEEEQIIAIEAANATFKNFGEVFKTVELV